MHLASKSDPSTSPRAGLGAGPALLLAAAAALGLEACGCTEVGCLSQARVEITADKWPPGVYTATVEHSGQVLTCTATQSAGAVGSCNVAGLDLFLGVDGEPAFINTWQTPEALRVVLERDGTTLLDETVEPEYESSRPNGAFCGPVCEFAQVQLAL